MPRKGFSGNGILYERTIPPAKDETRSQWDLVRQNLDGILFNKIYMYIKALVYP